MSEPKFPKHDPASAAFWEVRYQANFAPWEAARVPTLLADYARRAPNPGRVLIPGCGSATELAWLCELGWDAIAIDFSPAAVALARQAAGSNAHRIVEADFFADGWVAAPFDFIYERAFLCALPRDLWQRWAARVAELLAPGGSVGGFFFHDEAPRGPPFGLALGELERLLGGDFTRVEHAKPNDSIPIFSGKEDWQVWRRLAKPP